MRSNIQLHKEAFEGNVRKVAELLSMGADVNASLSNGSTPLVGAALGGHPDVCKLLLSKGASVSEGENGYSPLMGAAQKGHTEVCKLLLETGKANIEEATRPKMQRDKIEVKAVWGCIGTKFNKQQVPK